MSSVEKRNIQNWKSIISFLTNIEADRSENISHQKEKKSVAKSTTNIQKAGDAKLPRVIKLGGYDKPFATKKLKKELERAKGMIIMLFREKRCYVFTHGHMEPQEVAEAFGGMMKRTFSTDVRVGMKKIKPVGERDEKPAYVG